MISQTILTMNVAVINLSEAVKKVLEMIQLKEGAYVCVSNVHMCMEAFDSAQFRTVINQADLVIPDGKPLSVAQKLLGHKNACHIRGQNIFSTLCEVSGEEQINIGFYGGDSDVVLGRVKSKLRSEYSDIRITYAFASPFRSLDDKEDADVVEQINAAVVDVLLVGIGCPKQEYWMAEHKGKLNCVMLGVGAAFDFISGNKNHAPRWMKNAGLE
jgi:N-acetylglucosaminyldiphosphoundecaprenol N-acetyl-beta-D-mannosaminyltransferase